MKLKSLLFLVFWALTYVSQAQCPPSSPGYLSGTMTNMLASDTTDIPVFTTMPTGLPNTEFLVIQNDSLASDMLGPRIIFSSLNGRVVPSDLGLGTCNEICIVPFSYDLAQIRTIVDSLLGAYYAPGTSCCMAIESFFAGFCDSLSAQGINSGADVNDLNALITLLGIFAGTNNGSSSLVNLTSTIDQLNAVVSFFGSCTGGVTELCYEVMDSSIAMDCYTVVLPNSATSVNIVQDTVWLALGASTTLSGSFAPMGAVDTLEWSVSGSGVIVNSMTGQVTAGGNATTAWVTAKAKRGCAEDVTVVIVDPALSIAALNGNKTILQAIPNPFNTAIQVQFFAEAGEYTLELTGVTGQVFHTQNYTLSHGNQRLDINAENIPAGYYFLRVIGANTQGVQAVVKQ